MSIKIFFDFTELSWVKINQSVMNLYVTGLKFRIYKAAMQKKSSLMYYLQIQLMISPVAQLLVVQRIFSKSDIHCLSHAQKIFLVKNLNKYKLLISKNSYFYLLKFHYYKKNLKSISEKFLSLFNEIYDKILLFVLDPQRHANQHRSYISFYCTISFKQFIHIVKTLFISKGSHQYFIASINIMNLIASWHINFISTRVSNNAFICGIIKKFFLCDTNRVFRSNMYISDKLGECNLLQNCLISIVVHNLCIETYILYSSKIFSINIFFPSLIDFYIVHCGSELLILGYKLSILSTWCQLFQQLAYYFHYMNKITLTMKILPMTQGINFMGYFLCCYHELFFHITPSQKAQSILLYKIKDTCQQFQGTSKISIIIALNTTLTKWRYYFWLSNSMKVFTVLDYLVHLKLRRWILRNHPNWNKIQIKNKYFPTNFYFSGQKKVVFNNWIFTTWDLKYHHHFSISLTNIKSLVN